MMTKTQKIMGRMMCISIWAGEGKRKGFFSDCLSLKEINFTCLLFLKTLFVQDSPWVLSDWWGAGCETPTSQHRDPFALNTCGSNSLPLLTEWIITPHSSLPLCMRSILQPLDLEAQPWLGLPNGRWVVVTLVAELSVLRVGLLVCSCDALWAELVPQSHCPSTWASEN